MLLAMSVEEEEGDRRPSEYDLIREEGIQRTARWLADWAEQNPTEQTTARTTKRKSSDSNLTRNLLSRTPEEEANRYACQYCNNWVPSLSCNNFNYSRNGHYGSCVEYQNNMSKRETRSETANARQLQQLQQQKSSSSSSTTTNRQPFYQTAPLNNEDVESGEYLDSDDDSDSGNDSIDCGDHLLEGGENSDNNLMDVSTDYCGPSFYVLNHQNAILKLLSKPKLIRVRRHRIDNPESLSAFDYIKLAQIGELFNNRDTDGDELFKMLNEIMKSHGIGHLIQFPKQFISVRKSVTDISKKMTTVNLVKIPIDEEIWGIKTKYGNNLEIPYGVSYDIPQQIGLKFLECDPEKLCFLPTYSTNIRNEPIIKSFFDAKICHELHQFMIEQKGETYTCPKTGKVHKNMIVFILESEDGVALDPSKSKEGEPLLGKIANLKNDKDEYFLIGMSPNDPLRMSNESADEHLKWRGMRIKARREEEIKQRKREVHGNWYTLVHTSLTNIEDRGFFLKIERSDNADINVAFPIIVCLTGTRH